MFAIVFSLLIPGLGHVYMGKLSRALIWLAGTLALGIVLRQDEADPALLLPLITALNLFAALDIWLLIRAESPGRRGL